MRYRMDDDIKDDEQFWSEHIQYPAVIWREQLGDVGSHIPNNGEPVGATNWETHFRNRDTSSGLWSIVATDLHCPQFLEVVRELGGFEEGEEEDEDFEGRGVHWRTLPSDHVPGKGNPLGNLQGIICDWGLLQQINDNQTFDVFFQDSIHLV